MERRDQTGVTNPFPDILSKATHDSDIVGGHFQAEITGLFTRAHFSAMPIGGSSFKSHKLLEEAVR